MNKIIGNTLVSIASAGWIGGLLGEWFAASVFTTNARLDFIYVVLCGIWFLIISLKDQK